MTHKRCKYCGILFELRKHAHKRTYCYSPCCIEAHKEAYRLEQNELKRIYMRSKSKPPKPPKVCIVCGDKFQPNPLGRKRESCFKASCIKEALRRQRQALNEKRKGMYIKRPYKFRKTEKVKVLKRTCRRCGKKIAGANWWFCTPCHHDVTKYHVDPIETYGGLCGDR